MEDYTVNIIKSASQTQAPKKKKGLRIVSIILLVLGIVLCWVPVLGIVLLAGSLVFLIIAKKKGQFKRAPLFVVHIVVCAIAMLLGLLISPTVRSTKNTTKEYAVEVLSMQTQMEVYDDSRVESKKEEDGLYRVKGELRLSEPDFKAGVENIYQMDVDCLVRCGESPDWKKEMVENNSVLQKNVPIEVNPLPEAITKVDQKELVKKAEEKFHEKVQLKNESSYVLNDSAVSAAYDEKGNIIIVVLLDYSAENSFGGMVRSRYEVDFQQYKNGDIFCIGSKELS